MKYVMEYCRDHLSMLSTKAQRKLNQNHITLMTNIICNFTSSDFYIFFYLKYKRVLITSFLFYINTGLSSLVFSTRRYLHFGGLLYGTNESHVQLWSACNVNGILERT